MLKGKVAHFFEIPRVSAEGIEQQVLSHQFSGLRNAGELGVIAMHETVHVAQHARDGAVCADVWEPLQVLLGGGWGSWCLVLGVALMVAGHVWSARLVRSAEGAGS